MATTFDFHEFSGTRMIPEGPLRTPQLGSATPCSSSGTIRTNQRIGGPRKFHSGCVFLWRTRPSRKGLGGAIERSSLPPRSRTPSESVGFVEDARTKTEAKRSDRPPRDFFLGLLDRTLGDVAARILLPLRNIRPGFPVFRRKLPLGGPQRFPLTATAGSLSCACQGASSLPTRLPRITTTMCKLLTTHLD